MRTLAVWGAGRIGRGFVAPLFRQPGWRCVFVDVDQALVDALNERRRYTIFRATADGITPEVIEGGFSALHTSDQSALEALFREEGLLLDVAVHATELGRVASMLAPLLAGRAALPEQPPMDILMNVNMARPDEAFRAGLEEALWDRPQALAFLRERVGISGIAAACISPIATEDMFREDPLALLNNDYPEQAISEAALRGEKPVLPRLRLSKDISREETRKLYTLNMAHALLCYMGLPKGYQTVLEAMRDPALRAAAEQALEEACLGLTRAFGFSGDELSAWKDTVVSLLLNPYINDNLRRLGADTRRKLARTDRLVGPAALCMEAGRRPEAIAAAIHAGFLYENDDEGTRAVRALTEKRGIKAAVQEICGLPEDHPLARLVLKQDEEV